MCANFSLAPLAWILPQSPVSPVSTCVPAVSTCIPGVCLLPQCLPASLVSACFRSVHLHPWCLPASAVSTCIPGVCLLPQCPPASLVSAYFHSVYLCPVWSDRATLGRTCRSDGDVWSHWKIPTGLFPGIAPTLARTGRLHTRSARTLQLHHTPACHLCGLLTKGISYSLFHTNFKFYMVSTRKETSYNDIF